MGPRTVTGFDQAGGEVEMAGMAPIKVVESKKGEYRLELAVEPNTLSINAQGQLEGKVIGAEATAPLTVATANDIRTFGLALDNDSLILEEGLLRLSPKHIMKWGPASGLAFVTDPNTKETAPYVVTDPFSISRDPLSGALRVRSVPLKPLGGLKEDSGVLQKPLSVDVDGYSVTLDPVTGQVRSEPMVWPLSAIEKADMGGWQAIRVKTEELVGAEDGCMEAVPNPHPGGTWTKQLSVMIDGTSMQKIANRIHAAGWALPGGALLQEEDAGKRGLKVLVDGKTMKIVDNNLTGNYVSGSTNLLDAHLTISENSISLGNVQSYTGFVEYQAVMALALERIESPLIVTPTQHPLWVAVEFLQGQMLLKQGKHDNLTSLSQTTPTLPALNIVNNRVLTTADQLGSGGNFPTDTWINTSEGAPRFYFVANGNSVFRSPDSTFHFRNWDNGSNLVTVDDTALKTRRTLEVFRPDSNASGTGTVLQRFYVADQGRWQFATKGATVTNGGSDFTLSAIHDNGNYWYDALVVNRNTGATDFKFQPTYNGVALATVVQANAFGTFPNDMWLNSTEGARRLSFDSNGASVLASPTNICLRPNGVETNVFVVSGNGDVTTQGWIDADRFAQNYDERANLSPAHVGGISWKVGFGGWNNPAAVDWTFADQILLNTYADGSGGRTNLLCVRKSGGIGLRLFQGDFGSATPFTEYKDVALREADGSLTASRFTSTDTSALGPPSMASRSAGTRVVVWPGGFGGASTDMGLGVEANNVWMSSYSSAQGIKFYNGDQLGLELQNTRLFFGSTPVVGRHLEVKNPSATGYSLITTRADQAGGAVLFLNGSARSEDGGPNAATLRNDAGPLLLHGSGGKGLRIYAGTGNAHFDAMVICNNGTGGSIHYLLQNGGLQRWGIGLTGTESGGNAGSDFGLWCWKDDQAPSTIYSPLIINRSTGVTDFKARPTFNGGALALLSEVTGGGGTFTTFNNSAWVKSAESQDRLFFAVNGASYAKSGTDHRWRINNSDTEDVMVLDTAGILELRNTTVPMGFKLGDGGLWRAAQNGQYFLDGVAGDINLRAEGKNLRLGTLGNRNADMVIDTSGVTHFRMQPTFEGSEIVNLVGLGAVLDTLVTRSKTFAWTIARNVDLGARSNPGGTVVWTFQAVPLAAGLRARSHLKFDVHFSGYVSASNTLTTLKLYIDPLTDIPLLMGTCNFTANQANNHYHVSFSACTLDMDGTTMQQYGHKTDENISIRLEATNWVTAATQSYATIGVMEIPGVDPAPTGSSTYPIYDIFKGK
jgi:hypothetical protein